jgi:Phytanoyl-CoA dioxygenase (PhyH)
VRTPVLKDPSHDAALRDRGYIVLDLLPRTAIDALRAAFDAVEPSHRFDFVASVLLPDQAARAGIHAAVAPVLARHILPALNDYRVVLGNFAAKRARAPAGRMPLHQDCTFVDEDRCTGLTLWCPLVDVDLENGVLGVLPGSHRLKNLLRDPAPLAPLTMHEEIETRYLRYIPMRASEVMIMDNRTVHGSKPNVSAAARPVAAGVAIPTAESLLCCYIDDAASPSTTQIWEVPDDFYLRHMMRAPPREGFQRAVVPTRLEALSMERLEHLIDEAAAA